MPSRYPGKAGKCSNCGRWTGRPNRGNYGFDSTKLRCVRSHAMRDTHCEACCPETISRWQIEERRMTGPLSQENEQVEQEVSEPMESTKPNEKTVIVLSTDSTEDQDPAFFDNAADARKYAARASNANKGKSYIGFVASFKAEAPVPNVEITDIKG